MTEQDIQARLPRLLDKDLNEVCRLRPNAQSIELNISPLSSASLTLEDGSGVAIRAFVELYNAKGSVGIFRVSRPDESYGSGERISLEHGICVLDDAIVQGKGEIEGTPTYVIGQILSHQKTKADGKYLWALGTVAAPDSMTIKVEHDGTKTLEMLSKAMRDLEGYMLTFDQSAVPWVMNVVKKPDSVACEGRLSRNIRTIRKTMDDGDLCTRLYCSLLDGGYIESDTIGTWGEIEASITLNDDMPKDEADAYCQRYLENRKNPVVSIEMDADEWYTLTGERLDRFEVGDICRVALPEYGVTIEERIVALKYMDALGMPEFATVLLANPITDLSIKTAQTEKDISDIKNTSTGYGNRISTSERKITNLHDEQGDIKKVGNKMVAWFASVDVDLDATEDAARFGALASYEETYDLFEGVDTRVTEAELVLYGDGTVANAGLVARVEDNVNKIKTQNTALLDLKADTESATAVLSAQVADNTALIRATADDLGSEIELKADKIALNGYVTANALKAELANFELSLNDSITTRTLNVTASTTTESLHANTCSTSNLRVKGNGISLKSATVLLSGTSLTVDSTGGIVTGVSLNKKTDTLFYMSWE